MPIKINSNVKAVRNITWSDILDYAAPAMIKDRTLVPVGTPGKVTSIDKDLGIYLVYFTKGGDWWVSQNCITT